MYNVLYFREHNIVCDALDHTLLYYKIEFNWNTEIATPNVVK